MWRSIKLLLISLVVSEHLSYASISTQILAPEKSGHVSYWIDHHNGNPELLPSKNLGNEIFYQVFVDRFANGNMQNDCIHQGRYCDSQRQDYYKIWGGDLRGLIDRMPYLKNLGITRLWLTPIFDQQHVTVELTKYGQPATVTSYHGYWIRDWFRLNEYFTDQGKEDFAIVQELIAASSPEIKLTLDTVTNHTSPSHATDYSIDYLNNSEPLDADYKQSHRGALFRNGKYVTSFAEDQTRLSEPEYSQKFHHAGFIQDNDWGNPTKVEIGMLEGLSDIDQRNSDMYLYMRDAHDFWLDRFPSLAGYRMDTIKHINQSYWKNFNRDIFAGRDNLEIVGEYFGGGPLNSESYPFYTESNMSMFDFDFKFAIKRVFLKDAPMTAFLDLWRADKNLIDARSLVTFIDNHDLPRLRGKGMTFQRMHQAIGLLMTARGIPCIYYGLEQDLFKDNDPGDPYNRPMMTSFDQNHEFYETLRKLSTLRKNNEALRYGKTHIVHLTDHIIAYERIYERQRILFVTSKNPRLGNDMFSLQNLTIADGSYRDVLTDRRYQVENGKMQISIANGEMIIISSGTQ